MSSTSSAAVGEAGARGDVEPDPHHLAIVEVASAASIESSRDVGDRDLAALVEQHPGEAEPDPVGAAGDEGGAAGEVLHGFFASWPRFLGRVDVVAEEHREHLLIVGFSSRSGIAATIASARSVTPSRNSWWVQMKQLVGLDPLAHPFAHLLLRHEEMAEAAAGLAAFVALRIAGVGIFVRAGLARFLDVGGDRAGAESGADHALRLSSPRIASIMPITAALVVV